MMKIIYTQESQKNQHRLFLTLLPKTAENFSTITIPKSDNHSTNEIGKQQTIKH